MQNESSAGTVEPAATTHGAEITAAEAAQRLGSLGTEQAPETTEQPVVAEGEQPETPPVTTEQPAKDETTTEQEPGDRIPKERLDHEIEKRRKATEAREAAERERDALKTQIDAQAAEVAERMALDPSYLAPEDRKVILRANELEAEIAELSEHPEGVENDDPAKALTAQQVSRRLNLAQVELSRIGGRADASYRAAKQQQNADLALGRTIRLEREAASRLKLAPVKPAPRATPPAPPAASTARPLGSPGTTRPDISRVFKEAGGGLKGAEAALAAL